MNRLMLLLVLTGGLLCACAAAIEDAPVAELGEAAIATLQLRDHELTMTSTPAGVRYGVKDASGTRAQLTLDELAALAPEFADLVRSASAGLGLDARLDASVGMGAVVTSPRAGKGHLE